MTKIEFIKDLSKKVKAGQKEVIYMIKGKLSNRGYKKLFGIKGEQLAEFDDGVMCAFPAEELLKAVIDSLPTLTLKEEDVNVDI